MGGHFARPASKPVLIAESQEKVEEARTGWRASVLKKSTDSCRTGWRAGSEQDIQLQKLPQVTVRDLEVALRSGGPSVLDVAP